MLRYVARRLIMMIPVLIGVTLIVFTMIRLIPGDPVQVMYGDQTSIGQTPTEEELDRIRDIYGLNDPLPVQYVTWVGRIVTGDFGNSLITRTPVLDSIIGRVPATLQLAFGALALGLIVSIPLGVAAAVYRNGVIDRLSLIVSSLSLSVPNFWIALMAIVVFSVYLGWLPTGGRPEAGFWDSVSRIFSADFDGATTWFRYSILPMSMLAISMIAPVVRVTRFSMLEVLNADYIRTARAKGLSERPVVFRHALRNALIPVITIIGLQFAFLLSGAVLIETIFRWPGMGLLAYEAIRRQDYPVVQGTLVIVAVMFSLVNLLIDVLYSYVDPRIRYE